ncbi:MlaC/ttg2D family ABC transporter substrate-binding protein [Hahella ganghwensis]|uniref:MlaC/ttg2D family ABC transporter substrate-binding protein n=1 Tax=Hahella ganghwensis TaxID=286420 RepID=UPI0003777DA5|nr:ABC transporter substrate-binding protein [Hahella ganghwensis]
MKYIASRLCLVAMLMVAFGAWADIAGDVRKTVEDSTEFLVNKLEQERETYNTDPNKFYSVMEEALSDSVDFRRIAARVMGRYRREATSDQKNAFVEAFKKSLFNAYGKTLVESGEFQIDVLNADVNPRDEDKATVELEVTTATGSKYPVVYAMYKNSNAQKWLLENVVVNGVNIGLAFRDRFEQQYSQYNGDIDQVVTNWSSELAENEIKEASSDKGGQE